MFEVPVHSVKIMRIVHPSSLASTVPVMSFQPICPAARHSLTHAFRTPAASPFAGLLTGSVGVRKAALHCRLGEGDRLDASSQSRPQLNRGRARRSGEQTAKAASSGLAGLDVMWVGQHGAGQDFQDALNRALDLESRRRSSGQPRFNFDFRPHSHHWQVMAMVRADEHEAGTILVGGADVMMAMTSVGDGEFPIHLELDAAGTPTAIVVVIDTEA